MVDDENWTIRYMVVNTSNWLSGRNVLIALPWIDNISWERAVVTVNMSKDTIKNSPEYDATAPLTRNYESELHEHYGQDGYWVTY